ncbi:MAG: hypothetical protein COT74_01580 [Bdellovibrionales bacterium CG10_big_fil_rev_8_21_14_0_10_45_34]|nr:MAG: hypothetical protein COT74_01580 [Bdellovibrionales bacterium CG10_big_fil_rev_8_21_14_0_10_45_34]
MDYSIFDSLIDAVCVIDDQRRVVYSNEALANLIEVRHRKIKPGLFVYDFVKFSDPNFFCMPHGEWGKQASTPYKEVEFTASSGKVGKVQMAIQPDPNAASNGGRWVILVHDVTLEESLHTKYHGELEQKDQLIKELKDAQLKLEDYSHRLEEMVAERTRQLKEANRTLDSMLNCLGQGFLVFGIDGKCLPTYSRACENLLEVSPAGRFIWEVLKHPENKVEELKKWMIPLFMEVLPFKDLAPFGPNRYHGTHGRHVVLTYHPVRDEETKKVIGVVLVATDKTDEVEAQKTAEREKAYAKMVLNMLKNRGMFLAFIGEAREILVDLASLADTQKDDLDVEYVFRLVHTFKGSAAAFSVMPVVEIAHEFESNLFELKSAGKCVTSEYLKGVTAKLQTVFANFLDENGSLLGVSFENTGRRREFPVSTLEAFGFEIAKTGPKPLLENYVKEFVLEPFIGLFDHFTDILASIAVKLGKQIQPLQLNFEGGLNVWATPYQDMLQNVIHLFRNMIDHGIETPEKRIESGKAELGVIRVSAIRDLQKIRICFEDDGAGIDPEMVKARCLERGIALGNPADAHSVIQAVFASGFSTKDEVSEVSGRGVGMDAVKHAVEKINGEIEIFSQLGQGTKVVIIVPLFQNLEHYESLKQAA